MTYRNNPARVAGPFGYTPSDLAALTPEERDEMRRELGDLENKLQWGFEPGRWATGAGWHGDDWPEPNLLGQGDLADGFERRDDLIAEADDFRDVLGEADKVWKTQAGLNSPFLPALASLPKSGQDRVREQSRKFRELVAFGVTPDRWESAIGYLRADGHLLDPEADTDRLMGMYETREDMLPHLDATDHALDYLGEVEKQGADSPDAAAQPIAVAADNAASPTNFETGVEDAPTTSTGELDETRFVTGQIYPMPDGTSWQWNGRELVQARPGGGVVNAPFPDKWAAKGWGGPRGPYQVPTLTDEPERVANMQDDRPARFVVKENPDAKSEPGGIESPWRGWSAVRENNTLVEEAAKKYGVDPDLIRSVIWTEGALFGRGGFDSAADSLGISSSSLPMNIQQEKWAQLIGEKPDKLRSPKENIEAGSVLLGRIAERIDDPTPEKIGSIWNYSGRESVNDYGAYLGRIYREKPWRSPEPSGPEFDPNAAP